MDVGVSSMRHCCGPTSGMRRFEWPGDEPVEFHLGHDDMISLLYSWGYRPLYARDARLGPAMALRRSPEGLQVFLTGPAHGPPRE